MSAAGRPGRLARRVAPLVVLALAAGCAHEAAPRPSAVLVTLDTTNPGALGCYSGRAGLTPHLDALAAEGVLYENARSVAPLTLPSHASMMTGLWPPRHTLRDNGLRALPESAETLAEAARARGYQTAACVAAVVLGESYGLDQGFDVYDAPHGAGPGHGHVLERSSAEVTAAALRWLDGRDRARPFFLWVHYFDAHAPYDPAPEFLARAQALGEARFPAYLGEVAQVDDAVGALLARLRAEGLLEHTLVAVVGDHGESLGRHGEPTHSLLAYDATIRVPLLLRYPDGYRAGERSAEFVSVADVAPTLLEALDLAPGGALDGRSLYRRAVPPGRGVYFESSYGWLNYGWSPLSGWASAEGTYLHSSAPELFPGPAGTRGEERWAAEPALAARLLAALEAATAGPALADDGAAVDARVLADLRALGYAGGGGEQRVPGPAALAGLDPPRAHVAELAAFYEASLAAADGRVDEGVARLRALYAAEPEGVLVAEMIASLLSEAGRDAEAAQALAPLEARGALRVPGWRLLAVARERTGDREGALGAWLAVLAALPQDAAARAGAVRVLRALGRDEEAAALEARGEGSARRAERSPGARAR